MYLFFFFSFRSSLDQKLPCHLQSAASCIDPGNRRKGQRANRLYQESTIASPSLSHSLSLTLSQPSLPHTYPPPPSLPPPHTHYPLAFSLSVLVRYISHTLYLHAQHSILYPRYECVFVATGTGLGTRFLVDRTDSSSFQTDLTFLPACLHRGRQLACIICRW